ncbi:MAG: hypothetical protein PHY56_04870 [Candidatus Omnitrophica bacterium]|nr:hypothetical protein [Candidatus Omnitrophota bacterium]
MTPEAEQIKQMIDDAYNAVDKSKFGPICRYPNASDITEKQISQLAFGIYSIVLTGLLKNLKENK